MLIFAEKLILMGRIFKLLFFLIICSGFAVGQEPKLESDLALKYIAHSPAKLSVRSPVIILLHGYGSDEKDLYGLRSTFPLNSLIISVRAPYELPGGGYQWYESTNIKGQKDGNKEQLDNSNKLIHKFIDQVVQKYTANPKEVYLIGFSQGAIMCYAAGLSAPEKIKGIGVLSGMLFPSVQSTIIKTPALKKLKIFIAHGTTDDRIALPYGKGGNDYLVSIGLKPEYHQYDGMGHSISNTVINDLVKWLNIH